MLKKTSATAPGPKRLKDGLSSLPPPSSGSTFSEHNHTLYQLAHPTSNLLSSFSFVFLVPQPSFRLLRGSPFRFTAISFRSLLFEVGGSWLCFFSSHHNIQLTDHPPSSTSPSTLSFTPSHPLHENFNPSQRHRPPCQS